jgi:hypothetical protein
MKASTEDDIRVFGGRYFSLKSGFRSSLKKTDCIVRDWLENETLDLRLSLLVVTTETVTPPLLFTYGTDEVLKKKKKKKRFETQ